MSTATDELVKNNAPGEDRTHDLQMTLSDYETDALPTALPRLHKTIFFIINDKLALFLNINRAQ